jgi:hypothetical protein
MSGYFHQQILISTTVCNWNAKRSEQQNVSTTSQMRARIAQPVYTTRSCAGAHLLYYSTGNGGPFLGDEMPGHVPDHLSEDCLKLQSRSEKDVARILSNVQKL